MPEFCKSHDDFVQKTAKRIGFIIKQQLKYNPEIVLIISHTLQAQILHEVALDMFIDWKNVHLVLASGDLYFSSEENSCLSWLAKVLLQSPRVYPRTIVAPYVDLHAEIRVNEFYNYADLGHDTLGVYMPIDRESKGLPSDDDMDEQINDQQNFRRVMNDTRQKISKLQSYSGYKELDTQAYKTLQQSQQDNIRTFIDGQISKKTLLERQQVQILPTISYFKTQYDQAVAAAARKLEKLMYLGFPVILVGAADVDSFCGCVDEDATLVCTKSQFRAGKRVLERANEIVSTFDENDLYEFYNENRKCYQQYILNNYCFVGMLPENDRVEENR